MVYLDQFLISNLVKLLDPSHPSHEAIKKDPFWEELFIRLEKLRIANLIVCPDSFYHREESIVGAVPFYLMERLYEHYSEGKTFLPHLVVYRHQISVHFKNWLDGKETIWDFDPATVGWENFHEWAFGLKVSVSQPPRKGERDILIKSNDEQKDRLAQMWEQWKQEPIVAFIQRVKWELLAFKKLLFQSAKQFLDSQAKIIEEHIAPEDISLESIIPPLTNDIIEDMIMVARSKGYAGKDAQEKIGQYLSDPNILCSIPGLKISSLMYAGLAHKAKSGTKNTPKSMNDVHFTSAYLPYCDIMFLDRESAALLREIPKSIPDKYKIPYPTKIFSHTNKGAFLDALDEIYDSMTPQHLETLEQLGITDSIPFWDILIHEKASYEVDQEKETTPDK